MRAINTIVVFLILALPILGFCVSPDFKGLNVVTFDPVEGIQFDRIDAEEVASLNARWVRIEFVATQDSGRPMDYQAYDYILTKCVENNLNVLGVISSESLDWTSSADWETPAFRSDFVSRAEEIVTRYSAPPYNVNAWEIWNKPDYDEADADLRIEPAFYAQLLIDSYDAIKTIDSDAIVMNGGISERGFNVLTNYLNDLYNAIPIQAYQINNGKYPFDAVAIQPFPLLFTNPSPGMKNVIQTKIKNTMNSKGDRFKKVWITEMGWNSFQVGETSQASYLTSAHNLMEGFVDSQNPGDPPFIERFFWYNFEDESNSLRWGLYRSDFSFQKPAYQAYLNLTGAGPAPQVSRPSEGEEPPVWGGTSDNDLPIMVSNNDLVEGLTPVLVSGGLSASATGSLSNLTNGLFDSGDTVLPLMDSLTIGEPTATESPSLEIQFNFPQPISITEIRSFAGHESAGGIRSFQSFDVYVNGQLVAQDMTTGPYGQLSGGTTAVSLVQVLPKAGQTSVAPYVENLKLVYHPVIGPNSDFRDRYHAYQDTSNDIDAVIIPATLATILKEIDVFGGEATLALTDTWLFN